MELIRKNIIRKNIQARTQTVATVGVKIHAHIRNDE
jgi:hypothetical protein